ncbi:DUF1570 domain-containing protein [Candidatus Saccharibacteria bacterium]|nr:DUF1570 domain-containing protein [Candidatus Saccharibacteria bacterium]
MPNIDVNLVPNRASFKKLYYLGEDAPDYAVGFSNNNHGGVHGIISFSTPEQLARRKPYVKNPTQSVLLGVNHELVHQYTYAVDQQPTERFPAWLSEGLATFLSGQRKQPGEEGFQKVITRIANMSYVPTLSELQSMQTFVVEGKYSGYDLAWMISAYLNETMDHKALLKYISYGYKTTDYIDLVQRSRAFYQDGHANLENCVLN